MAQVLEKRGVDDNFFSSDIEMLGVFDLSELEHYSGKVLVLIVRAE